MVAFLEMPSFQEHILRISIEAYQRWHTDSDDFKRTELLRGIICKKVPPSPLHFSIADRLQRVLLASVPAGFAVRMEAPLTLRDSVPSPDLAVVNGSPDDYFHQHPCTAALVVEVALSNYPVALAKAELYAEAGVSEYWIVRPEKSCVEVYTDPSLEGYLSKRTLHEPSHFACSALPSVVVDLGVLFAEPRN